MNLAESYITSRSAAFSGNLLNNPHVICEKILFTL